MYYALGDVLRIVDLVAAELGRLASDLADRSGGADAGEDARTGESKENL